MTKVPMGEYCFISGLGLVKTIGRAKNCETTKDMVMFSTIEDNGLVGETLLLNEEDFIARIEH